MPNESKTRKPTRRADNEGSIYQRADGLWCAQVTVGYHPETGRPMRKTFYGKTKAEALGKKESTLAALQRGVRMTTGHIQTLEEFVREWMGRYKRPKVTPRTYEWYCTIAEKHIYPALGSLPLRNVTEDSVQDLLNQRILDEGYSLKLVKAVRGLLSQALSRAVKQGLIPYNPAAEAELPRSERVAGQGEKEAIPADLRRRMLAAAEQDEIMKPILPTLLFTGIRAGELLGLVWKNIDFEQGTMTIDRAVTTKPEYDGDGKRTDRVTIVAATKTEAGMRTFPLPTHIRELLREWKQKLEAAHPGWTEPDRPVFPNRTGEHRTYHGFRTVYRRFLARNELDEKGLNLHRYRHTFATMMLEKGVNPRTVQKLLGHRDIETTLGIYSHVGKTVYDDTASLLDDLYEQTAPADGTGSAD